MALSDSERRILQQLEQSFETDPLRATPVVRSERRRRAFATIGVLIGLVAGILFVLVAVGAGHRLGSALGAIGYVLIVLSAHLGVVLRTAAAARRSRAQRRPR